MTNDKEQVTEQRRNYTEVSLWEFFYEMPWLYAK